MLGVERATTRRLWCRAETEDNLNASVQSIFVTLKRFSALLSRGYDARNLNAAITDLIRSSSLRDALAPSLLREPLFSRHDFTVISLPSK